MCIVCVCCTYVCVNSHGVQVRAVCVLHVRLCACVWSVCVNTRGVQEVVVYVGVLCVCFVCSCVLYEDVSKYSENQHVHGRAN